MLKFCNVDYQYQQQKFHFDFQIGKGNIVAILGTSGAGKSTLLNLAAGFIAPLEGDIQIAGKYVAKVAPHKRPLAILFQEKNLFVHLSVADNIGLGLDPGLKLDQQQHQQVLEICQQLGIDKLLNRLPEQLSGGQKQRVALARCFVQNKPLLLLDEPFSALDPILRNEMLAIVTELAKREKVTVLMVTHHLSDVFNIASHYLFVDQGEIASAGEVAMLTKPISHLALQKFIQAGD